MLPTSMKMSGFVVVLNKTKDITPILPIGLDLKRLPKRGVAKHLSSMKVRIMRPRWSLSKTCVGTAKTETIPINDIPSP